MLLVDVVAINLMLYSSGGMAGSMGYLLMVTVAASGTFLKTRLALSIAAIASFIPVSIAMSEFLLSDGGQAEVVRSGCLRYSAVCHCSDLYLSDQTFDSGSGAGRK